MHVNCILVSELLTNAMELSMCQNTKSMEFFKHFSKVKKALGRIVFKISQQTAQVHASYNL